MVNIYVVVNCMYFKTGLQEIFCDKNIVFNFIKNISELDLSTDKQFAILLVAELADFQSMSRFWNCIEFISSYKGKLKVGIIVSKYSAYLTSGLSNKLHRKVTFFNAHDKENFIKSIYSWAHGYTRNAMKKIYTCTDNKHQLTLNEVTVLAFSLTGESMLSIAEILRFSRSRVYIIRKRALHKLGFDSYQNFFRAYLKGKLRTEFERPVDIRGRQIVVTPLAQKGLQ